MVKIDIQDSTVEWYWDSVNKNLHRRVESHLKNKDIIKSVEKYPYKLYQNIIDSIEQSFKNTIFLKDLITLPIDVFINKYNHVEWLVLYIYSCDHCREQYDNESELNNINSINNDVCLNIVKDLNDIFSNITDYKYISTIRGELVNKMNITVCPYCNGQYVYSYKIPDKKDIFRYSGDLDHILPKGLYQLFSMSIYNLVPSCKFCNQTLKGQKLIKLLNPYENGFFKTKYMMINFKDAKSLKGLNENFDIEWQDYKGNDALNVPDMQKKYMDNNIKTFRLNEIYSSQKEKIKEILFKQEMYNNKAYNKLTRRLFESNLAINKFIYGVSLNPELFKNELFSQMIYDIVYHN